MILKYECKPRQGDFDRSLKEIRIKNLNQIVLAHVNINSLRNKFDNHTDMFLSSLKQILMIHFLKVNSKFLCVPPHSI